MKKPAFNVIATRELRTVSTGAPVTVSIGAPQPGTNDDWWCPYLITGLTKRVSDSGVGVDAMQALILAIEGIRRAIESDSEKFSWEGEDGDHGFPRMVTAALGRSFASRH